MSKTLSQKNISPQDNLSLLNETDDQAFFTAWLALLVQRFPNVSEAVLVAGAANIGPFRPVALWPVGQSPSSALVGGCEQAMDMRLSMNRNTERGQFIACPVMRQQDLYGVVALAFEGPLPEQLNTWLEWGLGWLLLRLSGRVDEAGARLQERLMTSLDLMLTTMGEEKWQAASQSGATELALRLGCDRVSIGFGDGRGIKYAALSHSADFSKRVDLIRAIEAAMNEAADQGEPIAYPAVNEEDKQDLAMRIEREHKALVQGYGNAFVYSVPFYVSDEAYGVFLFEWPTAQVDPVSMQLADAMPAILGRVLLEKREQQLSFFRRIVRGFRRLGERLLGPRHTVFKLVSLISVVTLLFFFFAKGEFRLSASAQLEGGVMRVLVSPFDAFVASANVRAGQVVQAGQELARLDDKELQLEASRWASQQMQYLKQVQDAEAQHDLAQVQIARAQVQQAEARIRLVQQNIERATLRAPYDGIVVSGDLSQNLGGALKKGQTLFEIAPLESYRVVLRVDESDMSYIQSGQQGRMVVTALPGEQFPFTVTLVTPVAQAFDGKNSFRVEASLDGGTQLLRPGMEGIAKVSIGERPLVWIWTRRAVDWLRLLVWDWFGI